MNTLVDFLVHQQAPCGNYSCTTCGGLGHFKFKMGEVVSDEESLLSALLSFTLEDLDRINRGGNSIVHVLSSLADEDKEHVVTQWLVEIKDKCSLGLALLQWVEYGKGISGCSLDKLLSIAEPQLLKHRKYRDGLLQAGFVSELSSKLQEALSRDRALDEKARNAIRMKQEQRHEYLLGLVDLPFYERAHAIASDESLNLSHWRGLKQYEESWRRCSVEELRCLDLNQIQELIDLINKHSYVGNWEIQQRLFDRRHEIRIDAMSALQAEYAGLSPYEQLDSLLHRASIPIEHYPVELAEHINTAWLSTQTADVRRLLIDKLKNTHLRKWRQALKRCIAP